MSGPNGSDEVDMVSGIGRIRTVGSVARGPETQRRFILVGPLPPPFNGQSIGFRSLVDAMLARGIEHNVINITSRRDRVVGRFSLARAIEVSSVIMNYFAAVSSRRRGLVYVTIAQSPWGFLRDMVIVLVAHALGHRIVGHLKGGNYDGFYRGQPPLIQRLIRLVLCRIDRIVVLAESLVSMFEFDSRLRNRVAVVMNGLPVTKESTPTEGKRLLPNQPIRLLYLSNLIESKGYLHVITATSLLRHKHELNVVTHFCGEFVAAEDDAILRDVLDRRKHFEDSASASGLTLGVDIHYHGVVNGPAKATMLERSHFFILPTRFCYEGQPISMIEAMAYGCVLVSTDYRAIPSMLIDGVNGRFVGSEDAQDIARAIAEIAANAETYHEMSAASIKRYRHAFTREEHIEALLEALMDV